MITIIKALFITICVKDISLSKLEIDRIFNKTAENMFNEKLGDIFKLKMELNSNRHKNIQHFIEAKRSFRRNKTVFDSPDTTTTKKNAVKFTPSPKEEQPQSTMTLDEIRFKMKKEEINMIFRGGPTFIPRFIADDDDPNLLTQHFNLNFSIPLSRRVYYHEATYDNGPYMNNEKRRITYIMIQFIYMTRRQMGFMTVIRNKYKISYKYQIGYLFGLLRMVRQQQMILYKTMKKQLLYMDNAQIPLQFYYRIIMLGVDVGDIMRFIRKLDYKQKLAYNPRYYLDSSEYFGFPKPELP